MSGRAFFFLLAIRETEGVGGMGEYHRGTVVVFVLERCGYCE